MPLGKGILGFTELTPDERTKWDAECEQKEREEAAAAEAASKRAQDQVATTAEVENIVSRQVSSELAEENAETIRWFKTEFDLFKKCADKWDLPALPASPQMVAIFLTEQSAYGSDHLATLVRAISAAHRAKDFPNPCDDILVRAVLRLCKKEETQEAK